MLLLLLVLEHGRLLYLQPKELHPRRRIQLRLPPVLVRRLLLLCGVEGHGLGGERVGVELSERVHVGHGRVASPELCSRHRVGRHALRKLQKGERRERRGGRREWKWGGGGDRKEGKGGGGGARKDGSETG